MTDRLRPRYVGRPVRRVEDPRLLTGRGRFTDDHAPPRLLHAAFLRSPFAHARILGADVRRARKMPGVAAVFLAADLGDAVAPLRAASRMRHYHAWARRCV